MTSTGEMSHNRLDVISPAGGLKIYFLSDPDYLQAGAQGEIPRHMAKHHDWRMNAGRIEPLDADRLSGDQETAGE